MKRKIDSKEGTVRLLQYKASSDFSLSDCYKKCSRLKEVAFDRFYELWFTDDRACGAVKILTHNHHMFTVAFPFTKNGFYWLYVRTPQRDRLYQFSGVVWRNIFSS